MEDKKLEEQMLGIIYGNACGDAIGLLTEFMIKAEALKYYGDKEELEFSQKVPDMHRERWKAGDWTDDTDQMILIMLSILEKDGVVDPVDFGLKLKHWARRGFPELGDVAGMGIGATTSHVLHHAEYDTNPHAAALDIWEKSGRYVAPNGALMRTSILGAYQYKSLDDVQMNTLDMCKVTHADPRCQAATVAMTTAIALMLQRNADILNDDGSFKVNVIIKKSYDIAKQLLTTKSQRKELKKNMLVTNISKLKLSEHKKIGYIYKCLGSAFWALKQNNFRHALQIITMEAGDADTNGAAAGALLGCKLGVKEIPHSWLSSLLHKEWLDKICQRFFALVNAT